MKILFLLRQAPIVEPLGIMYLSAALKKEGHEVAVALGGNHCAKMATFKPDIVAYSVMTGDQNYFLGMNNALKERYEFMSVFGGPHPTFFPEDFRDRPGVDAFIRGEGEDAFPALIRDNLDGEVIGYPVNIDEIPHPDRTLFKTKIHHFMASRGCPYSCTYCYNSKWKGMFEQKAVRYRNVTDLCKEISEANPTFAYFQDDCFGASIKWMARFAREYAGPPYHCHLRADIIDDERVRLLVESGCHSVHVALETANEEYRKKMLGRRMSNDTILEGIQRLKNGGIKIMLQNMIGLPGTTIYDDLETLELNMRIKPDYAWCSIYQPYPGTVLGDECYKKHIVVEPIGPRFFETSALNFEPEHLSRLRVLQKEFACAVKYGYWPDPLTPEAALERMYKRERAEADKILYRGLVCGVSGTTALSRDAYLDR